MGHQITITRNVYPVGQGGFCSEVHEREDIQKPFVVVYDCGTLHKNKCNTKAIIDTFYNKIDILFISHFDEDHISLLPELLKGRKVDKIFIPEVSDTSRKIIEVIYGKVSLPYILATAPEDFFHQFDGDKKVITVRIWNPEKKNDTDHQNGKKITGNTEACNSGDYYDVSSNDKDSKTYWRYIPYNIEAKQRNEDFKKKLEKEILDYAKLGDLQYLKKNKSKLKKIYKSLDGGINQNSLMVCSVPGDNVCTQYIEIPPLECCIDKISYYKVGCLFTGDYDYSYPDELSKEFKPHKIKIGTLQIPHHGSHYSVIKKGFAPLKEFLDGEDGVVSDIHSAFVQFGEHNTHGHPSTMLMDMIRRIIMSCPFAIKRNNIAKVSECMNSEFNQVIIVSYRHDMNSQ